MIRRSAAIGFKLFDLIELFFQRFESTQVMGLVQHGHGACPEPDHIQVATLQQRTLSSRLPPTLRC